MRVIIACDSFKGSLTSADVGNAVAAGIRAADVSAETHVVEIADGGEGTVHALVRGLHGQYVLCEVSGPLGDKVTATYGISGDGRTAIMEMAQASGLTLLDDSRRNPLYTSTYGTGQMIKDALDKGCRTIVMGIGGSATNDGGTGMLSALGVRFYDDEGRLLKPCGESLENIRTIDMNDMDPRARDADFQIACDVNNPLAGPDGAAFVFAKQKGADYDTVRRLDEGLRNYARVIENTIGRDVSGLAGAGAAGGLGACFAAFFNATMKPGIELLLDAIHFDDIIADSDLIITGEGHIDLQSLHGKAPYGVLRHGLKKHIPVVAVGGAVSAVDTLNDAGFRAVFPVVAGPCCLAEAMDADIARKNLARTASQIMRLFRDRV